MERNNDYDELLSKFEDPAKKNPQKKPTPPPMKKAGTPPTERVPMEDISSDSASSNAGKKRGVYFSHPPREISKQAAREQGIFMDGETKRRVNKRSQALKESAQTKVNKKAEKLKNAGIMLGIIATVSLILCVYGIGCINDVLALGDKNIVEEVYVEKGMTDNEVIDILHDKKLIKNKLFCKLFIKVFDKDGEYNSGVVSLQSKDGLEKMIAQLKTDYTSAETVSLTFPEGWTIEQIAEKLEANDVCTASSFISTLKSVDFSEEYDFIKSIPDKEKRYLVLEGYMYPDTY